MESEKPTTGRQPIWVPIVHGAQVFLSVGILGLSGYLIHGKYFDTLGYDIFASLLTWLVVAYLLVTTYISSFHQFTHIFIVIGSNALLVIFWLAAMGATARLRSRFKYNVSIYGCYDDGSAVDSTTCLVGREIGLEKRAAVATKAGLSMMSAIAGLSALVMLLFIATLVHAVMTWNKSRSSTIPVAHAPQGQEQVQVPTQGQTQQQGPGYQMPQYAHVPQYQQQQQQQEYTPPTHPYSPPPQQTYSPPPQEFTPPPQQGYGYDQNQQYSSTMPGPPQGGQSELYTPAQQRGELPSPVQR
ncbi:hypothetical protein IFR05_015143 [Cadophora sp. M221]|nr:hypothetical protein IFR05_015143 [Cadophora sp. M221]